MLSVYTRAAFIHLQTCKAGSHQHRLTNNLDTLLFQQRVFAGLTILNVDANRNFGSDPLLYN